MELVLFDYLRGAQLTLRRDLLDEHLYRSACVVSLLVLESNWQWHSEIRSLADLATEVPKLLRCTAIREECCNS